MSTTLRPPCARQNARAATATANANANSTAIFVHHHFLLRLLRPRLLRLAAQRCCCSVGGSIRSTTTRCYRWEETDANVEHYYDGDEDENDSVLEAEILEFMSGSSKPNSFPTREELVEAGRADLAQAIAEKGGWLSLGWDLENDNEVPYNVDNGAIENDGNCSGGGAKIDDEEGSSILPLYPYDSHEAETSSSLEMKLSIEEESGIEGILSRLEKQRNFSFGLGLVENQDDAHAKFQTDTSGSGFFRISGSSSKDNSNYNQSFTNSQIWTSSSDQTAPVSEMNIQEDIEITPCENDEEDPLERESSGENSEKDYSESRRGEITNNELSSRLRNLESELSSVLRAVKSSSDEIASLKDLEESDLQKTYDAWEFQENEIMNAQDKLRSTRAKLAVLEGKMALAIIEAQKILEEKQKRIDDARRALRLLNSTCIVWPSPASEVLLAGSYDGWATLRKMEKSSIGIFSLWLQLYPGKYEIKFIVDGEWKIDPQRPTVNNNGYLNNLLIIS